MRRNTKTLLLAGTFVLIFIAIVTAIIMALRPFFNLANVVTGGK